MKQKARKNLREIKKQMEGTGINVKVLMKVGKPFVEILKTAKRERVSLIVMGSHGRSIVKEMFLGSVAENVIRQATVPVMILRR